MSAPGPRPGCGCGGDHGSDADPRDQVRDGTDRRQRAAAAPDPARVPVDERRPEHDLAFAAAYARYVTFIGENDQEEGDWQQFFASDVSAQLAVIAIEDVDRYRTALTSSLRTLQDPTPTTEDARMVGALGAVFDHLGTLAGRLDALKGELPLDHPLRATLGNLIRTRLSPMLQPLVGYYLAGKGSGLVDGNSPPADDMVVLGRPLQSFATLLPPRRGLSADEWPAGVGAPDWDTYVGVDPADYEGAYGDPALSVAERINHLATHHLFTGVHESFLAVLARVVDEARAGVAAAYDWPGHQPHYALFLAFVRLLGHARTEVNTFPGKHLDHYYRHVLRLEKRPSQPDHAHVLVELAKHVDSHLLAAGTLLKAGKDAAGQDVHAAVDRDLAANRARVVEARSVRRDPQGRILADRLDPSGAPAGDPTASPAGAGWAPFGASTPAEIGFAIASGHLALAEGTRRVEVRIETTGREKISLDGTALRCRLTAAKDWLEHAATVTVSGGTITITLELDGNAPPIVPYDPSIHPGYGFSTGQPVLLVTLDQRPGRPASYPALTGVRVTRVRVKVIVGRTAQAPDGAGITSLVLASDQGPIDPAQPFLAFGSSPQATSSLVIGSSEAFSKKPSTVTLALGLMAPPVGHRTTPTLAVDYLDEGRWREFPTKNVEPAPPISFPTAAGAPLVVTVRPVAEPRVGGSKAPSPSRADGTAPEPTAAYTTASRSGFVRLRLSDGFGTDTYPIDLAAAIIAGTKPAPSAQRPVRARPLDDIVGRPLDPLAGILAENETLPRPPVLPTVGSLTLDYTAEQQLDLTRPSETGGRFFHVGPFGHTEQLAEASPSSSGSPMLPRFESTAGPSKGELYLGLRDLRPPQDVALLFQVVDGTADPQVVKPPDHLHWSYLSGDAWLPFGSTAVIDETAGLVSSGIITLSVPAEATTEHTLLPAGLHWIRVSAASTPTAVCRVRRIAAQALRATYVRPDVPPDTITKPDPPDPAVKKLVQPYAAFGGRGVETDAAFAARVGERLRHKDRAITLWDYEHLVLEAFPTIHRVRCLNHTRYEPDTRGTGIYRSPAPGHVTVVTIPDVTAPDLHDPLRPATSLALLEEIRRFLTRRMSSFATLHVRNPQFEQVRLDLRVRFHDGTDESLGMRRLREAITRFLSPWAYPSDGTDRSPTFGGTVHKSVLVDLIEELPDVDYLTDVRLHHRLVPGATDGPDLEQVTGSRPVAVLVSVPAAEHGIVPIHEEVEAP